MRSKKILINSLFGIFGYAILMLSNFITRSVFVSQLGLGMAGVDTTFKNFLQVLSLAELGLSTGLIYKLYKPIEDKDNSAIKRVLNFYKQAYRVIAAIFMGGAVVLAFVVNLFVKDSGKSPLYIGVLFILYAGDTVASYLYANRKALIVADQNNYIVNRNDAFVSLITLVMQVTLLYLWKSFVIYAVVKIICRLIGASLIGHKFKKMYPAVAKDRSKENISGEERHALLKNMSAMLCHRVGGVSVTATGSAVISGILGTVKAGIYGNYTLITNTLLMLVTQVFNGITASFGNILTVEKIETVQKRFNLLYFFNYLIFSFATVSVGVLIQPFIRLWMHSEENPFLPTGTVAILLCYFYVYGMRRVILMAKDSAGLYRPDRYFAIAEAAINIALSIILVMRYRTVGALILANLISMLIVPMWTQPYLVYKYILKDKVWKYYLRYILYAVMTGICMVLTCLVARFCSFENIFLTLLAKAVVCLIIPNAVNLIVFGRSSEMRDLFILLRNVLLSKKKNAPKKNT